MFETEFFIEECRNALRETNPHAAVREVVEKTVADPAQIVRTMGEPTRAGAYALHRSPELTVINFVWGPHMSLPPHDHRMWAVIGLYTGKEANAFYRRSANGLQPSGGKDLNEKDVCPLGSAVIHSVVNPLGRLTGAIHVYGGDFFGVPRSQWDVDTLEEKPYDVDYFMRLFDESNRAM
jgi:predicted metal-dependent enzyme (double-stranded beta helix superfamily)